MSETAPRSRTSLWLILALCVAPVAASYFAYYLAPPARHTNYGDLIEGPPLPDTRLRLVDGTAFEIRQLRGKWVLLTVDSADCSETCQRKLVTMRQLRLTQGKDMERIERAWLISDEAPVPANVADDYRGTWLIRAAASAVLKRLPAPDSPAAHIYVVDPLGNVVLRYPRDADHGRMIKDLTRLLKTSRIG